MPRAPLPVAPARHLRTLVLWLPHGSSGALFLLGHRNRAVSDRRRPGAGCGFGFRCPRTTEAEPCLHPLALSSAARPSRAPW